MNDDFDLNNQVIIKKKRGRKPKNAPKEDTIKEVKVLKKRGRKPTGKVIKLNSTALSNLQNDENCIVAHLPLSQNDIESLSQSYKSESESNELSLETSSLGNINDSFNDKYIKHLESEVSKLKEKIKELETSLNKKSNDIFFADYNIEKLQSKIINKDSIEKSDDNECLCWWCCHKFDNMPFFLPNKYYHGKYHVFGHFCSPSCACAYNIDMNDYKLWERNSLIIKLYNDLTDSKINNISPSPPKQMLKQFVGNITIDEFRKKTNSSISYSSRFILPPMVPLKTLIEESYKDRNKYKWENKLNISKYNNLKKNINSTNQFKKDDSILEKIMGIKKIKVDN